MSKTSSLKRFQKEWVKSWISRSYINATREIPEYEIQSSTGDSKEGLHRSRLRVLRRLLSNSCLLTNATLAEVCTTHHFHSGYSVYELPTSVLQEALHV